MFEDYCAAHGKPCIPGSLYCSEECRLQDLVDCMESPSDSAGDNDLLYECSFCQSHNQKCIHTCDYTLGDSGDITTNYTHHHDHSHGLGDLDFSLDTLDHPYQIDSLDSVDNEIIQSNYRKWLIQLTPRLTN